MYLSRISETTTSHLHPPSDRASKHHKNELSYPKQGKKSSGVYRAEPEGLSKRISPSHGLILWMRPVFPDDSEVLATLNLTVNGLLPIGL